LQWKEGLQNGALANTLKTHDHEFAAAEGFASGGTVEIEEILDDPLASLSYKVLRDDPKGIGRFQDDIVNPIKERSVFEKRK